MKSKQFFLFIIITVSLFLGSLFPAATLAAPFTTGDIFVAAGGGQYQHYDGSGALLETLNNGLGGVTTGCAFDSVGNFYTTDFSNTRIVVFDHVDPHPIIQTINTGAVNPGGNSESIVFAANRDFYVGHPDGNGDILRYNQAGVYQQSYNVDIERRGSDWMDLAVDQSTMFYTSEGARIMRYDVANDMQLTDFANIGGISYALRLLPPGDGTAGLIVANNGDIKRLDGTGAVIQTYDAPGENCWFSMNLDPNGTSFWAADFCSSNFYKFNIATGEIELGPINTGTGSSSLYGICVFEELTAAVPPKDGCVAGYATANGEGLLGVSVELFDGDGILLNSAVTDENGYYEFIELGLGEYTVTIVPPLGFVCDQAIQDIMASCDSSFNFDMVEGVSEKLRHIWWWKIYLDDLRNDGPRVDEFTESDVDLWLQKIFDHFYSRTDGYAIQIENATYKGNPAEPLTFDDLATSLLDTHEGTYESYVRKNLLINLLNIASNKMSQNKVVSYDGATASQAMTYYYEVYEANKNWSTYDERDALIKAYIDLRKIFMGQMVNAGIIPLTIPNVMYKGSEGEDDLLPSEFSLSQNYPNPFNPSTEIMFNLPEASIVKLEIFNLLGQKVSIVIDGNLEAGRHIYTWNASSMSSGVYLYRLTASNFVETKKMILLK